MIVSTEPEYALISLLYLIYLDNVFVNMSTKEDKINERTTRDYNNTLNQQQDAINKTLDNTLHNIKRSTDEATREIPQYTRRITEYQEKTIQTVKDIASDVIETQKQIVGSFQSQIENNRGNFYAFWDLYNQCLLLSKFLDYHVFVQVLCYKLSYLMLEYYLLDC